MHELSKHSRERGEQMEVEGLDGVGGVIIKCVSETIDNCIVMEYYFKLFEWNCIVMLEMWKNLT